MGNAIGMEARALWLSLRNEGGWWSIEKLTGHWSPVFPDFEVRAHLESLRRLGFLQCRPLGPHATNTMTYAVTSSCQALPGYEISTNGAQHEHA